MALEGYPNAFQFNGKQMDTANLAYEFENIMGNPNDVVAYNVSPGFWIPVSAEFTLTPMNSGDWVIHGTYIEETNNGGSLGVKAELHNFSTPANPYSEHSLNSSNELVITTPSGSIINIGFIPVYTTIGTNAESTAKLFVYTGSGHTADCLIEMKIVWKGVETLPTLPTRTIYDSSELGFAEEVFHFPGSLEAS